MPGIGIGLGLSLGGGAGALAAGPAALAATVKGSATGALFPLARLLGSGSTLALISGGSGNLTLAGAAISATAGLGSATQTAVVRESSGQIAIEYPVTLKGDGAGAPAQPALRAMAAGAAIPTGTATADAGVSMIRNRSRHPILGASPSIQPRFPLFATTTDASGGIETAVTWPAGTTFKASVEIVTSTGGTPTATLKRLSFGGADTYTAPAGGTTDPAIVPDELPASAFGLGQFSKGDVVYLKQEVVFPTAGTGVLPIADGTGTSPANSGEGCYYGGTGSVDAAGSLASQGGTSKTGRLMKPMIVLGRHAGTAIWGGGDSISFGKNIASNADGSSAGSWQVLAAYGAGVPLTKVAVSGDRAAGFTGARRASAVALAAFHTHAVLALGTNDVGAAGVGAGLGGLVGALADALRAANPQIACWGVKVPLRLSGSSDGYKTLAGQTLQGGWGTGGLQDQANAAVAALAGGKLAGVIDINAGFADASDAYRWKTDGSTANLSTSDGTHPTQVRDADAAAIAQPIMAGWAPT